MRVYVFLIGAWSDDIFIAAQELSAEQKRCAERTMSKSLVAKQAWEEAEPKLTAASLSFNTKVCSCESIHPLSLLNSA